MAYKNIREVMFCVDLVTVLGQFDPKLVKWRRAVSARRIIIDQLNGGGGN